MKVTVTLETGDGLTQITDFTSEAIKMVYPEGAPDSVTGVDICGIQFLESGQVDVMIDIKR